MFFKLFYYFLSTLDWHNSLKAELMTDLNISENEVYAILIRLERTGTISFIRNNHIMKHHDSIITTDFFRKLSQLALME